MLQKLDFAGIYSTRLVNEVIMILPMTRFRFSYSFIYQGSSTRDSEVTISVFETSCHLLLLISLRGRGNPVKCLARGHNKGKVAGV